MENTQVGPFQVIQRLGTNRRQQVFHARQTDQNVDVALKFIKLPPSVEWSSALNKIEREVAILKKLEHEHLVKVYGAGVHEEKVFFASELVQSESLTSILSRRGRLATDLAVEYGRQIALLLEYIHGHEILHAKLTPDKILVASDHHVKVSDLRLNRSRRRRWDDAAGRRELDIAAYMAPEQFAEGATAKSDFYSLGVIMYEMLTGKLPYAPDTMGRMNQKKINEPVPTVAEHEMNCPIWLDNLVQQLLAPNPAQRPHSAKAIVFAFDELKKMDKHQKGAVSQVTGGFNPLTIGADKNEANRLLGKKTKKVSKKKKANDTPIYESIPFLIGGLLLIALIIGVSLVPASPEKLMRRGTRLMESDRVSSWREARSLFRKVMENDRASEDLQQEAEDLFYESKRRTLVMQAENGAILRFQDQESQRFGNAVAAVIGGEREKADQLFRELVENLDPEGEQRHIYVEARQRLLELLETEPLPTEESELMKQLADAEAAESTFEVEAAKQRLARIQTEYSDQARYEKVLAKAKAVLQKLNSTSEPIAESQVTEDHQQVVTPGTNEKAKNPESPAESRSKDN